MKREIKFRAWDKSLKKMSNPFNLFELEGYEGEVNAVVHNEECEQWTISINSFADEDIVLQQYTGLKDKNGVEIYEGDIVHYYWKTCLDSEAKPTDVKLIVIFNDGKFQQTDVRNDLKDKNGYNLWYEWNELEVIGNIYENPELLEK